MGRSSSADHEDTLVNPFGCCLHQEVLKYAIVVRQPHEVKEDTLFSIIAGRSVEDCKCSDFFASGLYKGFPVVLTKIGAED